VVAARDTSSTIAANLLGRLLDAHERGSARTSVRVPRDAFRGLADREACQDALHAAEGEGAVRLMRDPSPGLRHLVERVVLLDAAALYRYTGRTPRTHTVAAAVLQLRTLTSSLSHPHTAELVRYVCAAWEDDRRAGGYGPADVCVLADAVRCFDAVVRRAPGDVRDLRTFSRVETGSSKLVETYMSKVVWFMRQLGHLHADMDDQEAYAALGLEKFAQPVLVAGPLRAGGTDLTGLPYAGLPPEVLETAEPTRAIRTLLTVENLASFNRHVREARLPGDIVVYTGGFPSRAVRRLLRNLAAACPPDVTWHWGDIDPAGVLIALDVGSALGCVPRPHLMDVAMAQASGSPALPCQPGRGVGTPWEELGTYLALPGCHHLEQESTDPQPAGLTAACGSPSGAASLELA
jgi:hypothetical protein